MRTMGADVDDIVMSDEEILKLRVWSRPSYESAQPKEYEEIASQPFSRVIRGRVVDVTGEKHELHMLSFRGASSKLAEWQSDARSRRA
jgi:hypothetical protein